MAGRETMDGGRGWREGEMEMKECAGSDRPNMKEAT